MNSRTAAIVGAAWNAGNCCLIGTKGNPDVMLARTPNAVMVSYSDLPGGLFLAPEPANANRPQRRPVA